MDSEKESVDSPVDSIGAMTDAELNLAVAKEVMGWKWCPPYEIMIGGSNPPYPCTGAWQLPDGTYRSGCYVATDISAAWEVMNRLLLGDAEGFAEALMERLGQDYFEPYAHSVLANVLALMTPRAICEAAVRSCQTK